MALDAAFLKLVCRELNERLSGAKVDKVFQPERDEFVFILRTHKGALKLRVSASSSNPAVYITEHSKENPKQAPALCMLARKLFGGGRFIAAEQPGMERVVISRFECTDEMGDSVERCVIAEIMGRNSNVIFTDGKGRINAAVKQMGSAPDAPRHIIAGLAYTMPPPQNKSDPFSLTREGLSNMLSRSEEKLPDALLHGICGFSPIVCCELAYRAAGDVTEAAREAKPDRVYAELQKILAEIGTGTPSVALRPSGESIDFSFFVPTLYGDAAKVKTFESPSELLDFYYYGRDRAERVKQRTAELSRLVSRNIERAVRKAEVQSGEIAECEKAEELRLCGELITANIYRIPPNSSVATVENFYDSGAKKNIPLDSMLTAQGNAQKYFKAYRKMITRRKKLAEQLKIGENEIEWLRSVADEIAAVECEEDISRIREELSGEGYLRAPAAKKPKNEKKGYSFGSLETSDGFKVYYGKNNLQNDELTMRFASNNDLWFHVRESFGSHVVLRLEGRKPTETAIFEAARIAAERSKSGGGTKVPVDYTKIRYVRKPKGARPGKVLYTDFKTIIV